MKQINIKNFKIEIVSVAVIIFCVLVLIILNFNQWQKQNVLDVEADKIVSLVKEARQMAIKGENIGGKVYDLYGVFINMENDEAIIFADKNKNFSYDEGEAIKSYKPNPQIDYTLNNQPFENVFFMAYKSIDGVCSSKGSCGGDVISDLVNINDRENPSNKKFIMIFRKTGDISVK